MRRQTVNQILPEYIHSGQLLMYVFKAYVSESVMVEVSPEYIREYNEVWQRRVHRITLKGVWIVIEEMRVILAWRTRRELGARGSENYRIIYFQVVDDLWMFENDL